MFDASRARLFGTGLHEAFDGRWDVSELNDLIEQSLPSGAGHVEAAVSLGVPGGLEDVLRAARKLERGGNLGRMILLTFEEARSKAWRPVPGRLVRRRGVSAELRKRPRIV